MLHEQPVCYVFVLRSWSKTRRSGVPTARRTLRRGAIRKSNIGARRRVRERARARASFHRDFDIGEYGRESRGVNDHLTPVYFRRRRCA